MTIQKTLLSLLVAGLLSGSAVHVHAQTSFVFTPVHTNRTDTLGSDIVLDFRVTNTSGASLTLVFVRRTNNLPAGWQSSLCFDVCFPPNIDSVLTTPLYGSTPLAPQETRTLSVHVYPAVNHGTGVVRILVKNATNAADSIGATLTASTRTTSVTISGNSPLKFSLEQNYPNPFNPTTEIRYQIASAFGGSHATLKVFDVLGREVAILVNEVKAPGEYQVQWDAHNLSSGVFYYTLTAENFSATRKIVLAK